MSYLDDDTRDCPHTAFLCECKHTVNHRGPHECHCGGAWYGAGSGMMVVRLPRLMPDIAAFERAYPAMWRPTFNIRVRRNV